MAGIAHIFVSPLLNSLFGNLKESAIQEIQSIWGVEEELEMFESTVTVIQDVVEDAEDKQINSKAVRKWLGKLKDVAYDADDVLDEVATEALRSTLMYGVQTNKRNQVRKFVFSCFSSKNPILYRRDIARKISKIRGRLDVIAKERHDLHIENRNGARRLQIEERRETSSLINEYAVIGRQVEKEKIIQLLVSDEFSVIPIVGMGGLGKTTLAQFVYNDQSVKAHFGLRAWASVYDEFNVLKVTNAIIESIIGSNCNLSFLDAAQCRLEDILNSKKFLIVLDDVWDENQNNWDILRVPFGVGAKGSKIIVTTRNERVARMMGTVPSHSLEGLPVDDCWELFTRRAGILDVCPELEEIGRQIVQKCKGLPLAVKTLGGILSSKRNVSEWESILTSEIWKDDENEILPALRLSYHHLPPNQKQCFAYCSIFPKNHWFRKDKLVRQWLAAGFIQPKGNTLLEDIGGELFDNLLLKSFFQCSYEDFEGDSIYKMHDLMHNLAESISGDECLRMEHDMSRTIPKIARHLLLIWYKKDSKCLEALHKFNNLRTFLLFNRSNYIDSQIINYVFRELRYLRVLDLSCTGIENLPDSIGHLKHLRHLDLSSTGIDRLPESVISLCNLQTLNLKNCDKLQGLPKGITNLINLRHLDLNWNLWCFISLPGIGKLTFLQTLPEFTVNKESGCQIGELRNMRNLRGGIHISHLENVQNIEEAKEANLIGKKYLNQLVLKWDHKYNSIDKIFGDERVLEGLEPPANLKILHIISYGGVSFPRWIWHLSNLTSITFEEFRKCEHLLPPHGQLPSLHELTLKKCPKLQEFTHANLLPALTKLELERCGEKLLSSFVPYLTSLSSLTIKDFRSLRSLPHGLLQSLTDLRRLEISYCDELECWPKEVRLQDLPYLQRLEIFHCRKLESLADGEGWLPTTLESLEINGCPNLKSMPTRLENMTSLVKLSIVTQLPFFLPESALPITIEVLRVFSCDNLKFLPKGMQNLTSLEVLKIEDCPQLHSLFPDDDNSDYGLPTTLQSLTIHNCPNLKSLPNGMQNLTSLMYLDIEDCPNIESLPEDGLPATLLCFWISRCPKLKERCEEEGGQDWPKIQHISEIDIK
ncbi:putative disease resistance protein RGA3 [Tasmannia lanceolata]|uniref:putative disease resistance protein RGA3 n=1 Tax=Tasmannia lanceolata TaxID=3420 RepID=UPI00406286E6